MSDLRERVARAILETWHVHPWELADTFHKDNSFREADAAIALVRAEVLEEAARVADEAGTDRWIAAAIRALKSKS